MVRWTYPDTNRETIVLHVTVILDITHRLRLKRYNVSKAESVSVFRWDGEIRLALPNRSNRISSLPSAFHPKEESDSTSEMLHVLKLQPVSNVQNISHVCDHTPRSEPLTAESVACVEALRSQLG